MSILHAAPQVWPARARALSAGALALSALGFHPVRAQVTVPSSSTTVLLQNLGAGTDFLAPESTTVLTTSGNGVQGNTTRNWSLVNRGSITGAQNGVLLQSSSGATFENFGLAAGTGATFTGVALQNGGTVVNHQGATISSVSYYGLSISGVGTVTNDGTIQTPANRYGVRMLNGGVFNQGKTGTIIGGVDLEGGTITATNAGSIQGAGHALFLGSGASGTFSNGGLIRTDSDIAGDAVRKGGPGDMTVTGGTIESNGGSTSVFKRGVASTTNGMLTVSEVQVTTTGINGWGAYAASNGSLRLSNSSVTTSGKYGTALWSRENALEFTATDVTVITSGEQGVGAAAGTAATVGELTMTHGSILTMGQTAVGLLAWSPGSKLTATDVPVRTEGIDAFGAYALAGGVVDITGGRIETIGASAHGALASGAGSQLVLTNVPITTQGAGAHGVSIIGTGLVTATNVTASAGGADASALFVSAGAGAANTATFTGGSLSSTSAPTIAVASGTSNIALTRTSVTGTAEWLRVASAQSFSEAARRDLVFTTSTVTLPSDEGAQVVQETLEHTDIVPTLRNGADPVIANITASGATLTGAALTEAGSTATLNLQGGSTWNLTGNSNLTNLTLTGSLIDFSAPAAGVFKTLTISNNYIGQGGIVALNTLLGNDASPSDRLVLEGETANATGATTLRIKRAGGAGAVTTGNGILVIDAHSTTAPGAFSMSMPAVAGPYEYTLQRGSLDASAPESWYLRSTVNCASPGAASPPCPGPVPPEPPGPLPNYRAEVSLYAALAPTTLQYGRTLLDTLHERVGEQEQLRGRADLAQGSGRVNGTWARLIGMHGDRKGSESGVYGRGPSYDYEFVGVQMGGDLLRRERPDGFRDHAGAYWAIGSAKTEADHYDGARAGTDRFNGYTLGGYWTRFGPNEWYLDGIAQATWYEVKANSERGLPEFQTDGLGLAGSIEGGYRFKVQGDWSIEPQAQLIYQWVDLDESSDLGAKVRFKDVESLAVRMGVRIARTRPLANGNAPRMITGWVRLSAWHDFLGDPKTEFSSETGFIPFRADIGGSWGELKAGVTAEVKRNMFVYGSMGYQRGFDGDRHAWDGKIGLRVNW